MKFHQSMWSYIVAGMSLVAFSYQAQAMVQGKKAPRSHAIEAVPGEFVVKLKNSAGATSKAFRTFGSSGLDHVETINFRQNLHLLKAQPERLAKALGISSDLSTRSIQKEALQTLSSMPEVEYIEPNYIYRTMEDPPAEIEVPNDALFGSLWGMHNVGQKDPTERVGTPDMDIDAPEAWLLNKGSHDVVVAIVDTGIDYNHEDLQGNIWTKTKQSPDEPDVHGYNAINDSLNPMDDHSHGTHCSGTIGARGANGLGVVGVNWNVSMMGVKFLSGSGSGTLADAIKAIDWARENGAQIMSNSWGGGGFSQALYDAIDRARQQNILFVAAAGNDGSNNDNSAKYPAGYELDNVISVAASTNNDTLAYFSNYGQRTVHLMAPGFNIVSTVINNEYKSFSGTSMATPHVSGAAALLKASEPGLSYSEIKARLISSTDKSRAFKRKLISAGRLNVANLLSNISPPGPVVPPETAWSASSALDIQSPHPYTDSFKQEWVVEHPGAKFIRVRFSQFSTESGYDIVRLLDENGVEADGYSGNLAANTWSGEIEGSKITIRFESDNSVSGQGFAIDSYQWTDFQGETHTEMVSR
jgi:thermitase